MINKSFLGTLKKFENSRIDNVLLIKLTIKHTDEGAVQTFLNPYFEKIAITNTQSIFEYPVIWKKLSFDTSDFVQKTFKVTYGAVSFEAQLKEINVTHKMVEQNDVFDYQFHFTKVPSNDNQDKVIAEAYLNYKEENEDGKEVMMEFDVEMELLDKKDSISDEEVTEVF